MTPAAPSPRKRASGVVVPNTASRGQRFLAWATANFMRLLAASIRYEVDGAQGPAKLPKTPIIFAMWHNRLGLCVKAHKRFVQPYRPTDRLAALISASKDGAFLVAVLNNFGVQPVRGSSSRRGAQALLELSSWAERGYDIAVTPDGPRGPCYVVQDGVMTLAQVTGLPIVAFSYRLNWKITLKSWDRFQIPLPFARCEMYFGGPIHVPRDVTDEERARLRQKLHDELMAGTVGE